MEPLIHFRGAVSLLGRFPALAGVDLDVAPGEIVLLQGPNGAGKTTLLRCCAGLVAVVDGTAEVLGHDLRRDGRAVRRRVGILGHANGLYDELTVEDNVRFWCRAAKADAADVDAAMEQLGLAGRLRDVPVARLSAGQRRRTALAILVARRPELWLLDEPHAGLDAEGRDLIDDLARTAAASGATVLIASHDHDRAVAVADRCVTIAGGIVVDDGLGSVAATSSADGPEGAPTADLPAEPPAGPDAVPVSSPKVSSPDVSSPDVSSPDVSSPEVSSPDVSSPDVSTEEVSSPAVPSARLAAPVHEPAEEPSAELSSSEAEPAAPEWTGHAWSGSMPGQPSPGGSPFGGPWSGGPWAGGPWPNGHQHGRPSPGTAPTNGVPAPDAVGGTSEPDATPAAVLPATGPPPDATSAVPATSPSPDVAGTEAIRAR